MTDQFPTISIRDLNPSQRRAVRRIYAHYSNCNAYNGVTSIRFKLNRVTDRHVAIKLWTRRSDCEKYSPRQVLCKQDVHAIIGQRGGIEISYASNGCKDESAHIAHMTRRYYHKPASI